MAAAVVEQTSREPIRTLCDCGQFILVVTVPAVPRLRQLEQVVCASPFEWEMRARCFICANNAARVGTRCPTCKGSGYVGADNRTSRARRGEIEAKPCKRCDGLGTLGAPKRADCTRCGGDGYVGQTRPRKQMLAIDIAWSDDDHVRLIGPDTPRRKGEALYELHVCGHSC